jgi:hypothetical protein
LPGQVQSLRGPHNTPIRTAPKRSVDERCNLRFYSPPQTAEELVTALEFLCSTLDGMLYGVEQFHWMWIKRHKGLGTRPRVVSPAYPVLNHGTRFLIAGKMTEIGISKERNNIGVDAAIDDIDVIVVA